MKNPVILVSAVCTALLLTACSNLPQVQRVSSDQVTDISGDWNDTDANLTAQELISQVLGDPWLGQYRRAPTVVSSRRRIVGEIRNLSPSTSVLRPSSTTCSAS